AKARNACVEKAIELKDQAVSEIVERELAKQEENPEYETCYTLKDLNIVKDHLDQIKHHVDLSPRTSPSLLPRGGNLSPIFPVELTQTRSSPPGSNPQSPNRSIFEINDESDEEEYRPLGEGSRTNNNLENYERIIIQGSAHNTENNFSETSDSSASEVEININPPQDYEQEEDPQEWYEDFLMAAQANGWNANHGNAHTWDQLSAAFTAKYLNNDFCEQWTEELRGFKQRRSETVEDYYYQVRRMATRAELNPAATLPYFVRGLLPEIKAVVKTYAPVDLAKALTKAKLYESGIWKRKSPKKSTDNIKVPAMKVLLAQVGHFARDCLVEKKTYPQNQNRRNVSYVEYDNDRRPKNPVPPKATPVINNQQPEILEQDEDQVQQDLEYELESELDENETFHSEMSDYWDEQDLYSNPWKQEEYKDFCEIETPNDYNPALYLTETITEDKPPFQVGVLDKIQEQKVDELFTGYPDESDLMKKN
ncbi:13130_t:CDS:2, partial [Dentiscutata erythropus]